MQNIDIPQPIYNGLMNLPFLYLSKETEQRKDTLPYVFLQRKTSVETPPSRPGGTSTTGALATYTKRRKPTQENFAPGRPLFFELRNKSKDFYPRRKSDLDEKVVTSIDRIEPFPDFGYRFQF